MKKRLSKLQKQTLTDSQLIYIKDNVKKLGIQAVAVYLRCGIEKVKMNCKLAGIPLPQRTKRTKRVQGPSEYFQHDKSIFTI